MFGREEAHPYTTPRHGTRVPDSDHSRSWREKKKGPRLLFRVGRFLRSKRLSEIGARQVVERLTRAPHPARPPTERGPGPVRTRGRRRSRRPSAHTPNSRTTGTANRPSSKAQRRTIASRRRDVHECPAHGGETPRPARDGETSTGAPPEAGRLHAGRDGETSTGARPPPDRAPAHPHYGFWKPASWRIFCASGVESQATKAAAASLLLEVFRVAAGYAAIAFCASGISTASTLPVAVAASVL